MDFIPLITIPIIYFAVALLKPYLQTKLSFNLCAICIAVSMTWLTTLILWLFKMEISPVTTGVLIGMSISGIMYKMEKFYKEKNIRNFWLIRLIIIIGGLYLIIELLEKNWNNFSFILILSIVLIALFSLLFQGTTHEDVLNEHKKSGKDSSIIKKLDNCC